MAQYRQSGTERYGSRGGYDLNHNHYANGSAATSDHVAVGIRGSGQHGKAGRWRRSARLEKSRRVAVGTVVFVLCLVLFVTVLAYHFISGYNSDDASEGLNRYQVEDDDSKNDSYFLTNVTRMDTKVLRFGHGSITYGRDSRYWDKDDRRRDDNYNEDVVEHSEDDKSLAEDGASTKVKNDKKDMPLDKAVKGSSWRVVGLYNEAGRNELKKYEEEYQASLGDGDQGRDKDENSNQVSVGKKIGVRHEAADDESDYDDAIDSHDIQEDEYVNPEHNERDGEKSQTDNSSIFRHSETKDHITKLAEEASSKLIRDESSLSTSRRHSSKASHSVTKRKPRRHKFSGASCEMKLLNSSAMLVEPLQTHKFARFSLQYRDKEEKPDGDEQWVPRFAGHQSLKEREESFLANDKTIHCGFVQGPKGSPSTGFDLSEDDVNYISRCHIAVISCIFGNSDRLRPPASKMVSRLSKKNVCFVMFVDETTLHTLSLEGQAPDTGGFRGLWKLVVVKNLPYSDMRRVGKVPKLLPHRLFPSARYSIWLDSKLRLQLDPLLILEYLLWRKGHEYAISNHYDRHCVWEEVAQNKKLNKYNHTIIDQQFSFYQADGLKRFNASDLNKLLPSNVPEGSFIVRAHTPMSNLFSCLWFNEVDRFTSRDQLSFAYTYQKLRRMNPEKPFYLNMFKDCERRKIAKLFRHRSDEKRNLLRSTE